MKAIYYIVSIGLIWLVVCTVSPYWNKYWIESDLEEAALYGTKNSVEDTRKFFSKKLEERGYHFNPEGFYIEKDENKTVIIRWGYGDEISFFGFVLKQLEFTLDVRKREVKAYS